MVENEAKWRSLALNHPDFVVIYDEQARIVSINRVLAEFEEEKVIGTYGVDYIHEDFRTEWKRVFDEVLATNQERRFDTRGDGPAGETVWYETIFIPLTGDDPKERVLVVARDITARRAMIASLAEKERLASVGMLSASVAHEIMNPLTYVLANLDFALSDRCTEEPRRRTALEAAREGATRMQQIVWDLRSLGRPGGQELFYVDVRAVLETAIRLSGPEVAQTVDIVTDLREVPGVYVSESRLCQVFINLLINASHAMAERPREERTVSVRTHVDSASTLVGVDIKDQGAGIAPEHIKRIFDPFFTTKRTGTGLGLSISRDNLISMGGEIKVVSELGKGTTFTVWLPTARHVKTSEQSRS